MRNFLPMFALLALGACTDGTTIDPDDSGTDSGDTSVPDGTFTVALTAYELGGEVDCLANLKNVSTSKIDTVNTGELLTLEIGTRYRLTTGDEDDSLPDGTPQHRDENGEWASPMYELDYDTDQSALVVTKLVYLGETPTPDAYPVTAGGHVDLSTDLRHTFDLGTATCHAERGEQEADYEQEDFSVQAGFQFEVTGVADEESWLEIDEQNEIVLKGHLMRNGLTVASSSIDQENGTVEFAFSDGVTVRCY